MKRSLLFLSIYFCLFIGKGFSQSIKTEQFFLENGLSVYLSENPNSPNVFGAVIIKTGSKYDNPEHTGTAHYLEHMLFKGTESLGTTNYSEEKLLLSDIESKYEELYQTSDKSKREEIQKEINKLSLLAGEYAIPNELDKLLNQIGASMINAFTTEEAVAYFNIFPNNQLEKWLILYSHRFNNPVFRLFQSELETVFEEKNMYSDDIVTTVIEEFYKSFYKNHPYGTQTILGSNEHIKSPSLRNMKEMYSTYYVPNNMALVLTGDFKIEEAKPIIEKYFSKWKEKKLPHYKTAEEKEFDGREKVSKRLTPIKGGILGFRTVSNTHKDRYILEVCQRLLNNPSETGLLDQLRMDNKLIATFSHSDFKNDYGSTIIAYVPKIFGQSLKRGEKIILKEVDKLKTGDLDTLLVEAAKLSLIKEYEESLEDNYERALIIGTSFISGESLEDAFNYQNFIKDISVTDIMRVSKKYFGPNYLAFHSRMGFPSKKYLEKPGYDPIIPKNVEAKSEFSKYFETIESSKKKIDFDYLENLVNATEISDNVKLYTTENTINNIFNIKLKYKVGTLKDRNYTELCEYLKLVGNEKYSLNEFNKRVQSYGSSFDVYCSNNYFTIEISGFEQHLEESLKLIAQQIYSPICDKSKIKNIYQTTKLMRRYEKRSAQDVSDALFNYAIYGENSSYLRRSKSKAIKKINPEDLIYLLETSLNESLSIHYSGKTSLDTLTKYLTSHFKFNNKPESKDFPVFIPRKEYKENTIIFLNDKTSTQSNINIYIDGNINSLQDKIISNAFNSYFGTGMTSLVFQEIREFRSLAYTAYASYVKGYKPSTKGYFNAYIGSQCDKTIESLKIMDNLLNDMPIKENRLENVKVSLLNKLSSLRPNFRSVSEALEQWQYMGYENNPEKEMLEVYQNLTIEDIKAFYQDNITKRPRLITIVGNKKKIDMKELAKFGNIIFVNKNQIVN